MDLLKIWAICRLPILKTYFNFWETNLGFISGEEVEKGYVFHLASSLPQNLHSVEPVVLSIFNFLGLVL